MISCLKFYQGYTVIISGIYFLCYWNIKLVKYGLLSWEGEIRGLAIDITNENINGMDIIFKNQEFDIEIKGKFCITSSEYNINNSLAKCFFEGINEPQIKIGSN